MQTLQDARKKRGWSQAELARRSGLHPTTISLVERGLLIPYPAQLDKIARALGIRMKQVRRLLEETHRGKPL